jgi:hypothetical protein
MTEKVITENDFKRYSSEFDVFVVGSDQIWNPAIVSETDQLDTRFMLDFVSDKLKVSYASSIGSYEYSAKQKKIVSSLLCSFDALSVRERDSADYLNSFLPPETKNVLDVVDPTLLHSKQQWLVFFGLPESDPIEQFILVYALKKDMLLKKTVEFYRSELGYKVITIDQDPLINYKTDNHIKDASPEEFIELFNSASFVITNSFHGTCFSVNFNKNFIVTTPPTSSNRISNLLLSLGLQDRFVTRDEDLSNIDTLIDFVEPNKLLKNKREASLAYLEKAINGNKVK